MCLGGRSEDCHPCSARKRSLRVRSHCAAMAWCRPGRAPPAAAPARARCRAAAPRQPPRPRCCPALAAGRACEARRGATRAALLEGGGRWPAQRPPASAACTCLPAWPPPRPRRSALHQGHAGHSPTSTAPNGATQAPLPHLHHHPLQDGRRRLAHGHRRVAVLLRAHRGFDPLCQLGRAAVAGHNHRHLRGAKTPAGEGRA